MIDEIQEVKDKAFNLLSYRDRSAYELKDRLIKKGYKEEVVLKVIERLKELSYIDDNQFAEKWVKYRIKNKPRGKKILKKELIFKGIEEEIVDSVLNKLIDIDLEVDLGKYLAEKWIKSHENDLQKLKRYLYYKGFSADIINIILDKIENIK